MIKSKILCSIMATTLISCSADNIEHSPKHIKPSDLDSKTYLSCENFQIDYADNGLIVFDEAGVEIARHKSQRMSRRISPTSINLGDPDCTDIIPIYDTENAGYLMPTGKLFANQLFESIAGLYENTLAFKKNKKWGLIDGNGYEILKPIYDKVFFFEEDRWMVTNKGENYLVNMKGERQISQDDDFLSLKYGEKLSKRSEYLSCPDGTKLQSKNGFWGMIDESNNIVLEHKYRALHCFKDNLSFAPNDVKKLWCYVNRKGEFINENCQVHPINYQLHVRPEELSSDHYENDVLWMRTYLDFGESKNDSPPKFLSDGGYSKGGPAQAGYHIYYR